MRRPPRDYEPNLPPDVRRSVSQGSDDPTPKIPMPGANPTLGIVNKPVAGGK
jgi:hypothetical protein